MKLSSTPLESVGVGETFAILYTVTNAGTAAAEEVTLIAELSEQLEHQYGNLVQHRIVRLEPGQSHRAVLRAKANVIGDASLTTTLKMDGKDHLRHVQSVTISPDVPSEK